MEPAKKGKDKARTGKELEDSVEGRGETREN